MGETWRRRDYQKRAVEIGLDTVRSGSRKMLAAPTGTGKSVCILDTHLALDDLDLPAWVLTPRVEILIGMLDKLGISTGGVSAAKLVQQATELRMTTPARFRNMIERGEVDQPAALLIDEVHHSTAMSWEEIRLACGPIPLIGYTATPYRGTPRGTQELVATWGEPEWLLRIPEAIERGYMSCPEFRVVPLLDDDEIAVVNGSFQVSSAESETTSRLEAIADLIVENSGDVPTMVSVPSTEIVSQLCKILPRGRAIGVTQATHAKDRQRAFDRCINQNVILVQINVVSEGIDLPIRRLIDASPTMSPVRWMQQVGRITRPGGHSYYLCTNRNMERHGYLWAGAIPPRALKEAAMAFGNFSARSIGARTIGLEKIGKFRAVELPLADGISGAMYCFQRVTEDGTVHEFAAILHPLAPDPFYAHRVRGNAAEGYGKWSPIGSLPDMEGATARSVPNGALSPKQQQWWERAAKSRGLDGGAHVTQKAFQALPIMSDCGLSLFTLGDDQ